MYSYSHLPKSGWLGEFQNPADALIAGRARYGNADKIFIGRWEPAYYAQFLPSIDVLISMMRETVSDRLGDAAADVYDTLTPHRRALLYARLTNAVEEWEAELPDDLQFTGQHVTKVVGYARGEEVRKADFL